MLLSLPATLKTMIKSATSKVMMQVLQPDTFRMPQASDRFKIETVAANIRQYYVTNQTSKGCYLVTFMVNANGTKLVSCTCPDFANIKRHGRQCKHINVAYHFHVSRMKARQAVETVKATPTSLPVSDLVKRDATGRIIKVGNIRV